MNGATDGEALGCGGQLGASISISRDQPHTHTLCCVPGAVLDAECGPGDGLGWWTVTFPGAGGSNRLHGIVIIFLTSEPDWPIAGPCLPGTKDELMPIKF